MTSPIPSWLRDLEQYVQEESHSNTLTDSQRVISILNSCLQGREEITDDVRAKMEELRPKMTGHSLMRIFNIISPARGFSYQGLTDTYRRTGVIDRGEEVINLRQDTYRVSYPQPLPPGVKPEDRKEMPMDQAPKEIQQIATYLRKQPRL